MEDGRLKWFNCKIEVATQSRFNSPFLATISVFRGIDYWPLNGGLTVYRVGW